MRSREVPFRAACAAAALAAIVTAGCGTHSSAPPGALPGVRQVAADPYGSWVTVEWNEKGRHQASGELISVTRAHVLVLSDTLWTTVPTDRVEHMVVEPYKGELQVLTPYSRLSRSVSRADLERISRYARFPGGMPADVDRATLRSRPAAADTTR